MTFGCRSRDTRGKIQSANVRSGSIAPYLAKAKILVCPPWSESDHFRLQAGWSLSATNRHSRKQLRKQKDRQRGGLSELRYGACA